MFSKNKKGAALDPEQHRLVERAQRRIREKKQLYSHLVFFLVGGVFLIALNKVVKYGAEYDWSYWILLGWGFFLILHTVNVFVTRRILGPEWERAERDRLMQVQKERIAQIESEIAKAHPIPKKKGTVRQVLLIAAAGEANELGLNGDLPWHLPDDFKRFKTLTTGHPMIMGRKTFDTFPSPLPNREHIIITRDREYRVDHTSCRVVYSLKEALESTRDSDLVYVIGGGEIYHQALPLATGVELTRVHGSFPADTFFPKLEPEKWELIASEHHPADPRHAYAFTYETYQRK